MITASSTGLANPKEQLLSLFDVTIHNVSSYFLHMTGNPALSEELSINVYIRLYRSFGGSWWRGNLTEEALLEKVLHAGRSVASWQRSVAETAYVELIPNDAGIPEKKNAIRGFSHIISGLPRREQELCILLFLNHWKKEELAHVLKRSKETLEEEGRELLQTLAERCAADPDMQGMDLQRFMDAVCSQVPSQERTGRIRMNLLHVLEYRHVVFARVTAMLALFLLLPTALLGTAFVLPPVSLRDTSKDVAKAELILAHDILMLHKTLTELERSLEGLAALKALPDTAKLSAEFSVYAFQEYLAQDDKAQEIIERFGANAPTVVSYEPFAYFP